ncbi:MAG: hypothetical protein WCC97_14365 [Candidatus Acidiferrales bacterium]
MSKQEKKAVKKEAKPKREKGVTESGLAVARFLIEELGEKDAKRIATGMSNAAETKSMKRRLGRIATCVASASASASAAA